MNPNNYATLEASKRLFDARIALETEVYFRVFDDVQQKCEWTEDSDGTWNTDCKNAFVFNDGKPKDNGFNFCCYCGNELIQNEFDDNAR